jgi:hypothetical protein
MVNRLISYFYNNFFRGIKLFCVIEQQLPGQLPEIRAARPRLRQQNRVFPPQSDLFSESSRNGRCAPPQSINIFSLWLSYNNAAGLVSKSYLAIVIFAPG